MATGQPAADRRVLLVVADDFGIGPGTTAGILHLAAKGVVTGTVLLVNSPYAEEAVALWNRAGRSLDLGWHPNLTLDAPVSPAGQVSSLVDKDGKFYPLGTFLSRWLLGRLAAREIEAEFRAQLARFRELTGQAPVLVNAHQHIILFPPLGSIILDVMRSQGCFPYVRRVREPWPNQWRVPGARSRRLLLNTFGRSQSRRQADRGFPGNDWLAGVTGPGWVRDPLFHRRWLQNTPGQIVEFVCHPGFEDRTLLNRDCVQGDGLLEWRMDELAQLDRPEFFDAVADTGFRLTSPSRWLLSEGSHADAA